jgi:hypothetical protein
VEKPYANLLGNPKKDKPPSVLSALSNLRNDIAHFYSHADSSKIEELSILANNLLEIFKKSPISELKFWREDEKVYCGITEKESFLLSPLFYFFEDGYHFYDGIDFSGNPIYLSQKEGGRKKYTNKTEEWKQSLPLLEWENDIGMTYFAYLKKWEDEYDKKESFKHRGVENEVRNFISKGKLGVLLLRGEIGSGKTILLSSIINKFMESDKIAENSIEFIEFIGRGVNLNFLPSRSQDKKKRVFSIDKSFFFGYFF